MRLHLFELVETFLLASLLGIALVHKTRSLRAEPLCETVR